MVTGQITKIGGCEESTLNNLIFDPLEGLLRGKYSPADYYVDINDRMARKKKVMTVTVKGQTLDNVPLGSTLYIEELKTSSKDIRKDSVVEIEDGGVYHVIVQNIQYKPYRTTIEVPQ